MRQKGYGLRWAGSATGLAMAMLLGSTAIAPVHAIEIDLDNPDFLVRFDNTVKGTAGMRMLARQDKLAGNAAYDEGNFKFDRYDLVTKRIDVLSELDLIYKRNWGFRVSAASWYDNAYTNLNVKQNPNLAAAGYGSSYAGNRYSNTIERYYRGPSAEILDAFVFGRIDFGDSPLNFKLGKHAISWGTSTFDYFSNGVAYGQAPMDGRKGAQVPGSTLKELLMPVHQASAVFQPIPELSIAGQVMLDWKPSRYPEGGTFFGSGDMMFAGPNQAPLAPRFTVPRIDNKTPKKPFNGSFGVAVNWQPEMLYGTTLSAYYRHFDDPAPWLAPQFLTTNGVMSSARLVYPEDIQLFGGSANFDVMGASVGIDLSYRKDTPLKTAGISNITNEGPRGNTGHINVNFVKGLNSTPLYDTGILIAELSYQRLFSVTQHGELFTGKGYGGCTNGTRTGPGSKKDGCATRNFVGVAMQFTPQWLQVFPGVDLSLPITGNVGLLGNGAASFAGNERAFSYSISLQADINQRYKAALTWSQSHADTNDIINGVAVSGNGNIAANDRGWLSLSLQTSF